MARTAPSLPKTETLHNRHEINLEQAQAIEEMRARTAQILGGYSSELLVVVGPCSITENDEDIIARENRRIAELTADPSNNIVALHRMPPWKPRTNPDDWHGLETTDPEIAYRILHTAAGTNANVAIEMAQESHMDRYGRLSTLVWKGGRNFGSDAARLVERLGLQDSHLPVAIKNKLDGTIVDAIEDIDVIELNRELASNPAPTTLLYRGGLNAQTPEAWESEYLRVFEQTKGKLLVDVAHGGEQAHDPKRRFGKSVMGQIACLDHLIEITRRSKCLPLGVFIEASDAESQTDPVIPLEIALQKAQELAELSLSVSGEIQETRV
jgi:phospho-2-dehydro-3-deoxyheptonate aldolase